ncbi:FxsA family protein [Paenisporosarcina cavernae]|uniref:Membrane protein FxsA n=1 Tax=Paenisporosarcina cavernae TaxID=2320858 RepID=A0A385YWC4_9BACL|nr:FxsA family protein [Paenisporosarcina cavernae]AYC29833.1 membrane protein FxsA [Paenisporosarcina cavernae]
MKALLLAIIVLPALELALLMWVGSNVGIMQTLLIILLTGVLGAYFAKKQGLKAFRDIQLQFKRMEAPGDAVIDGLCVFAGGIMLLAPGLITDLFGFFLLFSPTRNMIKPLIYRWIKKKMKNGQIIVMRP